MDKGRTLSFRWIQLCFFLSGATGLIYQVLWTRRLTLTFGHTVLAVSSVLTAFMGGLALGSILFGRWSDRKGPDYEPWRWLNLYARLEGFIGVWALISLLLLRLAEGVYLRASESGVEGLALYLTCFLASAIVIVPPTIAMGATVPLLARLLVQTKADVGPILARLYGLNTMGALGGAALGGFFLLPTLGLKGSMYFAAILNLLVAGGAFGLATISSRSLNALKESDAPRRNRKNSTNQRKVEKPNLAPEPVGLVIVTFGLAGFASMVYQVAWNRALSLSIGSSVYAFSAILVAFLLGIALGSLMYQRAMRKREPRLSHLGWLYLIIGLFGTLTIPALAWLPEAYLAVAPWIGQSFTRALISQAGLVTLILLPPTLAMGLGFPLATAIYTNSMSSLGGSVGRVYGANTVGCILGSFISGFFWIPQMGAEHSLKLASLTYVAISFSLFLVSADRRKNWAGLSLGCGALFVLFFLPKWDSAVMSSGVAVYADKYLHDKNRAFSRPIFYRDGLSSAVSFHLTGEFWELPSMRVNGKVDASIGDGDRLTQYMLGYLPLLLHPHPENVAIIGLGGGFTSEAVAQFEETKVVDVVELEPAVLEADEFWKPYNNRVLEDPKVKVHLQDGRTFILTSKRAYDVIISEPSNPWIAGIGSLFTRDFYLKSRERLAKNGVMCQWFNLYHVSREDTAMVIRTFYSVFPHGSLWQSSGGDLILIGSEAEVSLDLERVRQFWRNSKDAQRNFFLAMLYKPDYLPGHFLMSREEALRRADTGALNTDDHPILEFSAPLSLYRHGFDDTQAMLFSGLRPSLPPGVENTPETLLGLLFAVANREDFHSLRELLQESKPENGELAALFGRLKLAEHETPLNVSKFFSESASRYPENPLLSLYAGELEYREGRHGQAAELFLTSLSQPLEGSEAYLCLRLGQSLIASGDYLRAIRPLLKAADLVPSESLPLDLVGKSLIELKRDVEAIDFLKVALERNPSDPLAQEYLAYAQFNTGDLTGSKTSLETLLKLVPDYDVGWLKLAYCLRQMGENQQALAAFQRAESLEPGHSVMRNDFGN